MVTNNFDKFLQLVQLDNQIYDLGQDQIRLNQFKSQLYIKIDQLNSDLAVAYSNFLDYKKKSDSLELELKTIDSNIIKMKDKKDQVSSIKEHMSIEHEILNLQNSRNDFESQLLLVWEERDKLEKQYLSFKEDIEKELSGIDADLKDIDNKLAKISVSIDSLEDTRLSKEEGIEPDFLDNYYQMRRGVHNPVVSLNNQNCSACFFSLTKQDLAKLKQQPYITCSSCYRMLYTK